MITELLHVTPDIDFGFGWQHAVTSISEPVTVWLNTVYNRNDYTITFIAPPGSKTTKLSDYEYSISYNAPGVYELQLEVSTRAGITIMSNTITLTVE